MTKREKALLAGSLWSLIGALSALFYGLHGEVKHEVVGALFLIGFVFEKGGASTVCDCGTAPDGRAHVIAFDKDPRALAKAAESAVLGFADKQACKTDCFRVHLLMDTAKWQVGGDELKLEIRGKHE